MDESVEHIIHPAMRYNELYKGPTADFIVSDLDGLGEALIKARILKDWSQRELGERLGVKHQQIQRWEKSGWQKAQMWKLQEVAEVLGVQLHISARLEGV